jgi:hypothetical protein
MIQTYIEPPSVNFITKQIFQELVAQLNIGRVNSDTEMNDKVVDITYKLIKDSDFLTELVGTELAGSFGLRPGGIAKRIRAIASEIANDTFIYSVPFSMSGDRISGGFLLAMGTDLFEKLKISPFGVTFTEKNQVVPWLRWTLEVGNAIVIADFQVLFRIGAGRSGHAIMVPDNTIGYRVPPQFAGTDHDNWITRHIIPNLDIYSDMILKVLNKNIK